MNAISLTWQPEGAFHHVGFVVASIPNSVRGFASMLQADWDEHVFHDPNQGVRVTFLKSQRAGDPLWELVEPADEQSPVHAFARSNHHAAAYAGRSLRGPAHRLDLQQKSSADRVSGTLNSFLIIWLSI
jgi:hypothetical protein